MKDNPIYRLSRSQINEYRRIILRHGKRAKQLFQKRKATPYNQAFIQKWLFKFATDLSKDTQKLLVQSTEEVIEKTIKVYNRNHKGDKLTEVQMESLKMKILKDFLLSEFKGATVDQRISQAERRLKVNLQKQLQNLVTDSLNGSYSIDSLINSITGKDYQDGGTAYRWNSRLVLSEMYRAYQFTAKVVLGELGVEKVEWVNSPRHEPKDSLIDTYAEKVYKPSELPDYPYPCNDSYFIPIY